ncbi:Ppx/GppA phosphatase family protein [Zeaxanthinibacter enoshimensis]|uniref:Exopolyphosphatase/guanosine-5'-triphosphate, 3'-diphosphate pyrophosphatase n=1 Tax=Zeaxanthinibacter enoshimensis TaxID=392009 RepID=A0A4R6TMP9_9FLAO|nr:rod shape-determining protein [Zeaxanthinibacter enoshimensis]TDQ31009.1 exopolyphosphatase/guanosine-5'-triphosphate,3'-diphosphate pyrophosphatase [Zeaxanthinibacter enoshimensis]
MKIRKFAAIDIGSNAIRLLVHNVIEQDKQETQFRKSSLIRVPVRLGEDTFTLGEISARNTERMLETMKAFKHLMSVMGVEKYMACATSAMREARNGKKIIKRIREESGVEVEIIDGKKEAAIIANTDLQQLLQEDQAYLYIDVGGGSTEFTLLSGATPKISRSFKVGTVRLLNGMVEDAHWEEIRKWIQKHVTPLQNVQIIGSGGNINKLHKMSGRKMGVPLSYIWLHSQYQYLQSMSYEDRIIQLGLNPDRADVIIPATRIFLLAAKWSGAKKIHVPKVGLSDGIIKTLYYTEQTTTTRHS